MLLGPSNSLYFQERILTKNVVSLQSPPSMKSCIMAAWLLTVSFGNLIVVILAGAKLTEDMVIIFHYFYEMSNEF